MVATAPKAGDKLVRGGTTSGRPGQIVTAANRWRENYNPLRQLTMRRVVDLLELGQRGDYAYLQWAYRFIERRNPTLSGLLSRCEAPLGTFDWTIKKNTILPQGTSKVDMITALNRKGIKVRNVAQRLVERPPGMPDDKLAAMQQAQMATLDAAYNSIDNLRKALLHLHKCYFRGYAHLQKHRNADGDVYHLECLHQWCICRDGLSGNWFWNPDSRSTSMPMQFLGKDFCIGGDTLPLADFIIMEAERPVDEVGIVDTVRRGLCEKNWDGFIEIYGIPGGVVVMPPNVPPGKESEYESTAKQIAEGAPGALPNGSEYKPNMAPRNVDPFTPRLEHLDKSLVLAGTGGQLTMMTEHSSGGGGEMRGSSKVHDKTFGEIANWRAREIAEVFQKQFDAEVLGKIHAGEPQLVYFDFGSEEEEDLTALCTNVGTLAIAGFETDADWLGEKTGIPLTKAQPISNGEPPPASGGSPNGRGGTPNQSGAPRTARPTTTRNRETDHPTEEMAQTLHEMILPLTKRLLVIAQINDAQVQQHSVTKLLADFPAIAKAIAADHSLAKQLSPVLEHSLIQGLTTDKNG